MNNRAILTCFHKYTPYGGQYYEPILDFYLMKMRQFEAEYDHLYLIDSNWDIKPDKISNMKASIIKVSPHLRYYDAYKLVLPQIKEDLILLLDNDTVIYKPKIIDTTFWRVEEDNYDGVSIFDTIGMWKTDNLNGKNKFCPYFFCTRREELMKYLDIEWGSEMPEFETLGRLTKKMVSDGLVFKEFPEDKNSIYFDGTKDEQSCKNTGVYHIRAGSTPAVLLAWKDHQPEEYKKYLKTQPKNEYLRQIAWHWYMCQQTQNSDYGYEIAKMLMDIEIDHKMKLNQDNKIMSDWHRYIEKFIEYHGL